LGSEEASGGFSQRELCDGNVFTGMGETGIWSRKKTGCFVYADRYRIKNCWERNKRHPDLVVDMSCIVDFIDRPLSVKVSTGSCVVH